MKRSYLWLILSVVAALCALDSIWLSVLQRDLDSLASYCHIGEGFDCLPALKSRYGKLFGIPLSNFAVGQYLLIFALSVQPVLQLKRSDRNSFLLLLLNSWGTIFCFWLVYISYVRLKAYCPFCLVLHILTPVLFLISFLLFAQRKISIREIFKSEWISIKNNKIIALGIIVALLMAVVGVPWVHYKARERLLDESPAYKQILEGKYPKFEKLNELLGERAFRGTSDAKVTIVEFADFMCPICRESKRVFEDLMKSYDVKLIFVPYPRSRECNPTAKSDIPNSCYAALVAEFASRRGKLWETYDAIFDDPEILKQDREGELARIAGASNMAEITNDTQAVADLQRDIAIANISGVKHTPSIFINNMGLEGMPDEWFLFEAVDKESRR